jgi:hypothetical protein
MAIFALMLFAGEALGQVWAVPEQTARDTSSVFVADSLDSAAVAAPLLDKEDLKVVKREHSYRRQVGLALFMMAFVAIVMTTADAFNPR